MKKSKILALVILAVILLFAYVSLQTLSYKPKKINNDFIRLQNNQLYLVMPELEKAYSYTLVSKKGDDPNSRIFKESKVKRFSEEAFDINEGCLAYWSHEDNMLALIKQHSRLINWYKPKGISEKYIEVKSIYINKRYAVLNCRLSFKMQAVAIVDLTNSNWRWVKNAIECRLVKGNDNLVLLRSNKNEFVLMNVDSNKEISKYRIDDCDYWDYNYQNKELVTSKNNKIYINSLENKTKTFSIPHKYRIIQVLVVPVKKQYWIAANAPFSNWTYFAFDYKGKLLGGFDLENRGIYSVMCYSDELVYNILNNGILKGNIIEYSGIVH